MAGKVIMAILSFIAMCGLTLITATAAGNHEISTFQLIGLLLLDLAVMCLCAWLWDDVLNHE